MRKHHKQIISGIIESLGEANAEIQKAFFNKDTQTLTALLADCADVAAQIGDYIIQLDGEDVKTIKLLSEYADILHRINNEPDNGYDLIKQLKKQTAVIVNSVKNDIKADKLEVVFFPYKASMWDSLESIWLAAKDDPQCDAYVVPIPSYELNPDGSLGKMVYDGGEYPDYIPVVDWQSYNIEERRPDVIFTHYPYDDNVTNYSIHPDFYSKRLREHCEQLIHVPYYVVSGDKYTGNYCALAGVVYAHRVIVQSEVLRKHCIEEYNKFDKQFNWNGRFGRAAEKFTALGSPKFDKVVSSKREECTLPAEWLELIGNKKVVLYNTHMWQWLEKGYTYFEKLRSVFDTFRERDDVVLWWRPHPNTEANFRVKRPEMLSDYKRIISEYRSGGFGIYDDTADLHRAIAWSDGYYGDYSSLVAMYGTTGKPIVIQDVNDTSDDVLLLFADFAVDDEGGVWAFEMYADGLFKLDFKNNTANFAIHSNCMPKYMGEYTPTHRYIRIHCYDDEVICFPFFLDNVLVYNRTKRATEKIQLNRDYLLSPASDGFAVHFTTEFQKRIYAFGIYSKAIIVFDPKTHNIQYDTTLYKRIDLIINDKKIVKYPLYISECSEDGKIILLMKNCEHLIRYNLLTQEVEIIATNPALSKCVRADFDGQDYWLIAEKNDKLIKWNPDNNVATEYLMSAGGFYFSEEEYVFSGVADCGDYILLIPWIGSKFLKFDKKTEQFSEYLDMPVPIDDSIFKYDRFKCVGDKMFAFARFDYTMYELDKSDGKVTPHKFKLDKDDCEDYFDGFFDNIYSDVRRCNLGNIAEFFSEALSENSIISTKRRDMFLECSVNKDGTAGKSIYKYVKSGVKL